MNTSDRSKNEARMTQEISEFKARIAELESRLRDYEQPPSGPSGGEAVFRLLAENTSANLWIGDLGGKTLWVSPSVEKQLGYSQDEFIALSPQDYMAEHSCREFAGIMSSQLAPGSAEGQNRSTARSFEVEAFKKNGERVWLEVRTDFLRDREGKPVGIHGMSYDVTERQRFLDELRLSEERFKTAAKLGSDHIMQMDLKTGSITWLGKTGPLLGDDPARFPRDMGEVNALIHPEDRNRVIRGIVHHFRTGEPFRQEYRLQNKDGDYIIVLGRGAGLRDESGKVTTWMAVSQDVTAARRAEQALRESEERFRMLAENTADVIWTMDLDLHLTYLSPSFERLTGWKPEEQLHQSISNILGPKSFEFAQKIREQFLAAENKGLNPGDASMNMELKFIRRDGSQVAVELVATGLRDDSSGRLIGVHGVARDITLRKQIEEERAKAERLESIGLLAGGIAHDFNNILATIMMSVSFCRSMVDPAEQIHELLGTAETATKRARDLTNQLLTFSKGGAPVTQVSSIAEIIRESAAFAMHGSNVKCELSLPEDLWLVKVDQGQISQVLHNIVINARQAMDDSGTIRITASNTVRQKDQTAADKPGKFVAISIQDHGPGIPPQDLVKISDPFFSTKPKGSGLGLATSYSIITRHGGTITVESEMGKGTTFIIYLPVTAENSVEPARKGASPRSEARRVLLMDDEESIRKTSGRILEKHDIECVCAADGEEAVEAFLRARESDKPFDLVILDLTVPGGKGGLWTIEKLREVDPQVRAIVASGYSNSPVIANYCQHGFKGKIIKPFSFESLLEEIAQAME